MDYTDGIFEVTDLEIQYGGADINNETVFKTGCSSDEALIECINSKGFADMEQMEQISGLTVKQLISDLWDNHILSASKICGNGSGIPKSLSRYLKQINKTPKTNWRQLLQDYIRNDKSDYTYQIPDKRYQDGIIMPSFEPNVFGSKLENLWFLIDTSGFVSDEALTEAYSEIYHATLQIDTLEGKLSFFDTEVSEPIMFRSTEELIKIKPTGGGGTSFKAIFTYLQEKLKEELPAIIIIITDGYGSFPKENEALGISVIWIIVDSDVKPPFGNCVYIKT